MNQKIKVTIYHVSPGYDRCGQNVVECDGTLTIKSVRYTFHFDDENNFVFVDKDGYVVNEQLFPQLPDSQWIKLEKFLNQVCKKVWNTRFTYVLRKGGVV